MCGITGFWSINRPQGYNYAHEILRSMMSPIHHRGPDQDGIYIDSTTCLGLAHKRLSIVDLTPTGSQPMMTHSGKHIIVYNGELYNTADIKSELAERNIPFKGHSDTEVLIEAIEAFGIENTLQKLNGMFAFAAYDISSKTLYLARDQMGIKPLFWSYQSETLTFCSELKALINSPFVSKEINTDSLNKFFHLNYIPGTQSIFNKIHKLQPGHFLTLKEGLPPKITQYWTIDACKQDDPRPNITNKNYIDIFETLLSDSVRRQMVSDVPLGVFLSGGIDSSLVASFMQENSSTPIKTFTIGFEEDAFNESHYALKVANHIGSDHHQEILSSKKAQDFIANLPYYYDEPFADSSQLPSMLLCNFARKHVTVCLSGDGGDELFVGYNRYFYGHRLFKSLDTVRYIPFVKGALSALSKSSLLSQLPLPDNADLKLQKILYMIDNPDVSSRYQELVSLWTHKISPMRSKNTMPTYFDDAAPPEHITHNISYMQRSDIHNYLPEDILQKMDRASMASSLEARVPLLDIRCVKEALSIPLHWHTADGKGKYILRSILKKRFPSDIFDRPKHGFSVPIGDWLKSDILELAETYLSKQALADGGYLNCAVISERWEQHKAGTHNWQHSLWGVLMFQMWKEYYKV